MLLAFNKPYGVLTQFTDQQGRPTLKDYIRIPAVYPAGRLDLDSEGLLLLTDEGPLAARITHPAHAWDKVYLLQVEGTPSARALQQLERGVTLKDGLTRPAAVEVLAKAPGWLWPRTPPVRFRAAIATHWLQLTLREGRNRQARRMTAAVGLPTLRLVRIRIGPVELGALEPGCCRTISLGGD
jgi:23S rRNA pseudouridine2457 synthase